MFAWTGSPLKTGTSTHLHDRRWQQQGQLLATPRSTTLIAADQPGRSTRPRSIELANQIDTILWEDLATIPLFTFPGLEAHSDETSGRRVSTRRRPG